MGMEITIDNLDEMCDLMCDNNIPNEVKDGRRDMNMRQNLNWLLEQYIQELDNLDTDIRDSDHKIGVVGLIGRASVYRKVIEDLTGVLEGEDE